MILHNNQQEHMNGNIQVGDAHHFFILQLYFQLLLLLLHPHYANNFYLMNAKYLDDNINKLEEVILNIAARF